MPKKFMVSWAKAKLAAAKRLPFMSEGKLETRCQMAGFNLADAYMCGAEEAQGEILRRLNAMRPAEPEHVTVSGNAP